MLYFVIGVVSDVVAIIVTGFCGMILWNWYMPLIFETVPLLTFVSAAGLALVSSLFISSGTSLNPEDFEDEGYVFFKAILNSIVKGMVKPIILVVMGFLLHFFV